MNIGIEIINKDSTTFYITLEDNQKTFMSMRIKEYSDNCVVFVDTKKFIELWRKENQHTELSYGDKSDWEADYKYDSAVKGFSYGISNPVPLAYAHCYNNESGEVCAEFTNGITRTIWLLSKGAKAFPLETDSDSAPLFEKYAGIGIEAFPVNKLPSENHSLR